MDGVWIELSNLDDLLDLSNSAFGSLSHCQVEVVSSLSEQDVASLVGLPALDQGKVTSNGLFQYVSLTIEYSGLVIGNIRLSLWTAG